MCVFCLLFAQRDTFKNRHHIWPNKIYFYVITFLALVSEFFFCLNVCATEVYIMRVLEDGKILLDINLPSLVTVLIYLGTSNTTKGLAIAALPSHLLLLRWTTKVLYLWKGLLTVLLHKEKLNKKINFFDFVQCSLKSLGK